MALRTAYSSEEQSGKDAKIRESRLLEQTYEAPSSGWPRSKRMVNSYAMNKTALEGAARAVVNPPAHTHKKMLSVYSLCTTRLHGQGESRDRDPSPYVTLRNQHTHTATKLTAAIQAAHALCLQRVLQDRDNIDRGRGWHPMRSWRACMVSRRKARGKQSALVGTGKRWGVTRLPHSSPCRHTLRARALSFWTEHTCLNLGLDDIEGEGEKPVRPAQHQIASIRRSKRVGAAQRQHYSKLCKGKSQQL